MAILRPIGGSCAEPRLSQLATQPAADHTQKVPQAYEWPVLTGGTQHMKSDIAWDRAAKHLKPGQTGQQGAASSGLARLDGR